MYSLHTNFDMTHALATVRMKYIDSCGLRFIAHFEQISDRSGPSVKLFALKIALNIKCCLLFVLTLPQPGKINVDRFSRVGGLSLIHSVSRAMRQEFHNCGVTQGSLLGRSQSHYDA